MSSFSTRSLWVRIGKSEYLQLEDQKLIELVCRQADSNAYCVLYDRHKESFTNFFYLLYQNRKRAMKESVQLFVEVFQKRDQWRSRSFQEFALSIHVEKLTKLRRVGQNESVVVDELEFIHEWNKRKTSDLLEDLEQMDFEKLNDLSIWMIFDLGPELQANILSLSVSQWRRELASAMRQWFEISEIRASNFSKNLGSADQKLRSLAKRVFHQDVDPEMDFIFWSRFEKECRAKSPAAKWWAPVLLFLFLALVILSAFFHQELPGQVNEEEGAFSFKLRKLETPSAAPTSSD